MTRWVPLVEARYLVRLAEEGVRAAEEHERRGTLIAVVDRGWALCRNGSVYLTVDGYRVLPRARVILAWDRICSDAVREDARAIIDLSPSPSVLLDRLLCLRRLIVLNDLNGTHRVSTSDVAAFERMIEAVRGEILAGVLPPRKDPTP